MAKTKQKATRRRRRAAGMGLKNVVGSIRPTMVGVGFAVEKLGAIISGFIPANTQNAWLVKLRRSPQGLGLTAAGYFLKSPDVMSVGLGMAGAALTAGN